MPMQKTHKFFISKAEADKEEFQVQTEWLFKLDADTQTFEYGDYADSGVQVIICLIFEIFEMNIKLIKKVKYQLIKRDEYTVLIFTVSSIDGG
jgi:hypothetical protein